MPEPQRSDGGQRLRAGHSPGAGLWVHLGGTDAWVWEDLVAPVIAATTPLDADQEPLLLLAECIADCLDAAGEPDTTRPADLEPSVGLTRVGGAAEALLVHVELAEDRGVDVARAASSDRSEAYQYRRLRAAFLCVLLGHAEALPSWLVAAETLAVTAETVEIAEAAEAAEAAERVASGESASSTGAASPASASTDAPAVTPAAGAPAPAGAPLATGVSTAARDVARAADRAVAANQTGEANPPTRPAAADRAVTSRHAGETPLVTPRPAPSELPPGLDARFSAPRVPLLYWLVAVVDPGFPGARMVEPHVFKAHLIGAETREPLIALLRGQWPSWPGFDPEDALPLRGAAAPRLESEPVSAWAVTTSEWAVTTAARYRAQLRRFVHLRALERIAPARHRDLVDAWAPDLDDAMLAGYGEVMNAQPWEPCDAACWAYLAGERDDVPNCPWLSTPDSRMADVMRMLRDLRATLDAIAGHPRGAAYLLLTREATHPNDDPATSTPAGPPASEDERPADPPSTDLAIPWQLLENTP